MQWVIVAQFGKAHGLKGWIKVRSFTQPGDNLLRYSNWHVQKAHGWEKLDVERVQHQGNILIAKLEQVDDRDSASNFTNRAIAILSDDLPKLSQNQYYWFDLIGLKVINTNGAVLGTIESLMDTGANDVLVVKGLKEHLIPYVLEQFVINVDLEKKEMRVDWDENF